MAELPFENEEARRERIFANLSPHHQLSAILNYAEIIYNLPFNPVLKVERIGRKTAPERPFWTVEEYQRFSKPMQDTPLFYYAFQVLFWCGIREGELLALTPRNFDLENCTLTITNSYHRSKGRDVIGDTKTPTSCRSFKIPSVLAEEIKEYISSLFEIEDSMRIFPTTKKRIVPSNGKRLCSKRS